MEDYVTLSKYIIIQFRALISTRANNLNDMTNLSAERIIVKKAVHGHEDRDAYK